ncbi:MAG TPA: hypothetical protein VFB80_23080 [Pirellulaceae bacterium]|nr:hypothetical protein [Pirellulaceae bacterium]
MSSLRQFVPAALLAALFAASLPVGLAAGDDLLTVKASSVGFGGKFKSGFWQPVRATLVAGETSVRGRLEVVAADGDQTPVIYANEQAPELNLSPQQETTVLLYAKSGPIAALLVLQLRTDAGVVWSQDLATPTIGATQEFVVGIGPSAGLDDAAATLRRRSEATLVTAQVQSAAELPDVWWAYSGVDAVLLTTSDAKFLESMSAAQRQALIDWVLLGGRLVLAAGARGAEITAAGSAWQTLVPGDFEEVVPLRERAGLETFTRTELPFQAEFFQRNRPLVTRLKNVRGEVLLGEASALATRPLAVHAPAGLGEVTFVALDLDHPSLAAWEGRSRLIAALIQRDRSSLDADERQRGSGVGHLGYSDLVGQLRLALEQFSGVTLVNFTTVAVLTIVFLLIVGPGDYLLLSRTGWPRQLTWITFPLLMLAATLAFGYISRQAHGTRTRLNLVEIVDFDVDRGLVRGTVWAHLYSPRTARYDVYLHLPAAAGSPHGWLSWQGLPGEALGGLGSRQVVLASVEPYRVNMPGPAPATLDLPTTIASSKSLSAQWWAKTPLTVESKLALDEFGLVGGEFTQPLPVELSDCLLAHGEKLFRLGTLQPGARVVVDPQRALNLEWRLTERRVEQSKDVTTPWNQAATDVPQIVQMLMFHEAAGGRSYTGLSHRYQPQIDLSEHIRLGQAVLVGRAKQPVAGLGLGARAGEAAPLAAAADTTTWTWYRLILPVSPHTKR